jgi:MFS family permease
MIDDGHQHATGGGDSAPLGHHGATTTNSSSSISSNNNATSQPSQLGNPTYSPANFTGPTPVANTTSARNRTDNSRDQTVGRQFAGIFPATKKALMKHPPLISQEKFHWDQTEQGHILGAFFYGYILFQIPGARMAELVGARWILMVSTAGSALISLVFPLSTQLDSVHLLMVLRFVMGLCQSAFFPAAYVFFCRWLPEAERSVLLPIMFIGSNMGSISTYIMSSYLISSSYGWPSVFYVSGMICLFVTLLWCVFGSNGPQDNWLITKEERDYIMENMNGSSTALQQQPTADAARSQPPKRLADGPGRASNCCNGPVPTVRSIETTTTTRTINKSRSANDLNPNNVYGLAGYHPELIKLETEPNKSKMTTHTELVANKQNDDKQLPASGQESDESRLDWRKLLTSVPVWTLIFSMYGNEWSQVVLTYELPTYLNKALDIPIEQNGVINSFFQLSYTIASPILSSLGAYMLERHLLGMRKIHVRKLFQSLATFGQLACFVSVPICGANKGLIIMFMFSAIVFKACANAGDIMVSGDLSPEFAGTIFALANSIGNTAGFFVPILAGVIVQEQYVREQWTPFWLTSAAIMGCSGLIFLVFGETRRQNYSLETDDQLGAHSKESNGADGPGKIRARALVAAD